MTQSLLRSAHASLRSPAPTKVPIRPNRDSFPVNLLRPSGLYQPPRRSLRDPLTWLLSRQALLTLIDGHIARDEPFSLILINLDAFRAINDTMGHDYGDKVLHNVADALSQVAKSGEGVARYGGDEFGIVLPAVATASELKSVMDRYGSALRKVAAQLNQTGGILTASLGGTSYPCNARSRGELLKFADMALHEAKAVGGGRGEVFRPDMKTAAWRSSTMRDRASSCLREPGRLLTYYQPKIDLKTGAVVGYEALLRCLDDKSRIRGPSWILAGFDDVAMALALGEQTRRRVFAYSKTMLDLGECAKVALNISPWELQNPAWPQAYLDDVDSFGIPSECLEIEVLESVFLGSTAKTSLKALEFLHSRGVSIALDDFGTGFASLTHLRSCPVDTLKIDRSFTRCLANPCTAPIVESLIGLARSLSITIVAEGVETVEQHEALKAWGCHQGQGYFYGRPAPYHQ